jgi:predicted ATPase
VIRGTALTAQGQAQEGLILIRDGIDAIRSTGTNIARSRDLGMLAEAQHALGQIEDGLATVAEALAFVEQTNEHYIEADLYRLQGELTLDSDAASQACNVELNAENCFQRAIKIAKRQQAKSIELRASTSLARLWQQQNKGQEALRLLSEVYNWFSEGFDTKDLQEARALLAELG